MIFAPRDGRPPNRFTVWRVGLFFLAAGTWIAGVMVERPAVTGAAIVFAGLGVLLGLVGREPPGE